jgi:uncharacterized protein involved in exopolysaccharide biosynthesis
MFVEQDSTIAALIASLLSHWRAIVIGGAIGFVLLVAVTFMRPRTYTTSASFVPSASQSGRSRLAGLAAQLGVSTGGDAGDGPALYADLLRSRGLLRATVQSRFTAPLDGKPHVGTLLDYFGVAGSTPVERTEHAVDALHDEATAVSINRETSVVGVTVSATSPELAQQIAARMLELVNEFNLRRRQTQAANERAFVEARLKEARDSLSYAEERLRAFRAGNLTIGNSSELRLSEDRLQRAVNMNQQMYTSLAESYDQARIDEVRNTPSVTVIEVPTAPVKPDSRHLLARAVFGLMAGALFGALGARAREVVASARAIRAEGRTA